MENLLFRSSGIDEFNYSRNLKPGQKIDFETSIKYSVHCFADRHILIGNAIITVNDSEKAGLFRMKFHHMGTFSYEGEITTDEERRKLHVETSAVLQPLWNQAVVMFCTIAGIPPVLLPAYRVNEDQIRMGGDPA